MFDECRSDKQDTCEQMTAEHTQGTAGSAKKDGKRDSSPEMSGSEARDSSPDSQDSQVTNRAQLASSPCRGNCKPKTGTSPTNDECFGAGICQKTEEEIGDQSRTVFQEDLKTLCQSHSYRPYYFWNLRSIDVYNAGLCDVPFKFKLSSTILLQGMDCSEGQPIMKTTKIENNRTTHSKGMLEKMRKESMHENLHKTPANLLQKRVHPHSYAHSPQQPMNEYLHAHSNVPFSFQNMNQYPTYNHSRYFQGAEWTIDPYGVPVAPYVAYGYQSYPHSSQSQITSTFPEENMIYPRSNRRQA